MDLHHLRHFVAVAEELHFGRAAKRLGMAQPPLSQSIMRLEESLGTKLLNRDSRQASLTPAGTVLLVEARDLLTRAAVAERAVLRAAAGEVAKLRIGLVPMSAMQIVPQAMLLLHKQWPDVEVQLYERPSKAQMDAVREGTLDAGIVVHEPGASTDFDVRVIERYRQVAVVPSSWPLAKRRSIVVADLANQPLILFPPQLRESYLQPFTRACRRAGFTPRVAQKIVQPYTMFNLVANGVGIGLVQDTASVLRIEGVAFVPVRDMPDLVSEVALIWIARTASPSLRALIDIIGRLADSRLQPLGSEQTT
jgi:DNA-binding transcriptional LysR family regulator